MTEMEDGTMKRNLTVQKGKPAAHDAGNFNVKTLKAGLHEARTALAGHETPLSAADRRAARRWRRGFEVVVNTVVDVAPRYGLQLAVASLDEVQASLDEAEAMAAPLDVAREVTRSLEDRMVARQAPAVRAVMAYYTTLSQMSHVDPKLHDLLAPARAFFSIGKRAPKQGKASKPAESAANSAAQK